ncbi:MAG: Nucleotide-binding protein [Clostridiales bacterium 38_11]|nr:MAG: Nucleotide-binding protein [Clostridiales bacterium 38_11]HBH12138.1 thiamine diphosphokinase [Clostridiales bacterium]
MSSKCLIITGGDVIDKDRLIAQMDSDTFVICVDKGAETALQYNIRYDLVIGDFDSISNEAYLYIQNKAIKFPLEKDYSDTELAVVEAIRRNMDHITIVNATGNRIDHVLSTFLLLYKYKGMDIRIIGNDFESFLIQKDFTIINKKGMTLSLIPMSETIENIFLEGFKYPLHGENVQMGDSLCISNIITDQIASIRFLKGIILVIITNLEE